MALYLLLNRCVRFLLSALFVCFFIACDYDEKEQLIDTDGMDQSTDSVVPEDTDTDSEITCLECHQSEEALVNSLASSGGNSHAKCLDTIDGGSGCGNSLDTMENWQRVLVGADFVNDRHFKEFFNGECTGCHRGVEPAKDMDIAHKGLVARPSYPNGELCSRCHAHESDSFAKGLHYDNRGVYHLQRGQVAKRAAADKISELSEGLSDNCSGCHIKTCGSCHISRSDYSGNGFVQGHLFSKRPNVKENCLGCHGTRKKRELYGLGGKDRDGNNVQVEMDAHVELYDMSCFSCHKGHTNQFGIFNRYEVEDGPTCEDCHQHALFDISNQMHVAHADPNSGNVLLQCQVCHSQPYNNCAGCHLGKDGYVIDSNWYQFKIGKNPLKSVDRPYDYVTVRHIPVVPSSFDAYGEGILQNFSSLPTWKYTTAHNIVKEIWAPGEIEPGPPLQARECNSCHGNEALFLTTGDLTFEEVDANRNVIVVDIPQPIK